MRRLWKEVMPLAPLFLRLYMYICAASREAWNLLPLSAAYWYAKHLQLSTRVTMIFRYAPVHMTALSSRVDVFESLCFVLCITRTLAVILNVVGPTVTQPWHPLTSSVIARLL